MNTDSLFVEELSDWSSVSPILAPFYAHLLTVDKSSQIQPELSRRILIPGRVGAEPANETVIIVAELAGVASFVVKGASLTLPRGIHTVWRAGVQQNRQSNGILFRAEEWDRLRAAVFEDRDIGSRQPAHVAFLPVGNLNADRLGDWCPSVVETLRKRLQVARACGAIQAGSSYPPELVPGDIVITSRSCAREGSYRISGTTTATTGPMESVSFAYAKIRIVNPGRGRRWIVISRRRRL
jgi:hypothetical protein